ncbi:MAG: hypothetical protein NC087_04390 [Anaeroplasma bactoclasticum]|nr:hypothetical protein [Anaeroplasma bactoclasticum]
MPLNININLKPTQSDSNLEGESITLVSNPSTLKRSAVETPTTKFSMAKTAAIAAGVMVGRQAMSYVTSNVGKWTGNSQNQVMANNVMEGMGLIIAAIQSLPLAVAMAGIRIGSTALNNYEENYLDNKRVEQASARAGYRNYNEAKGTKH